MSRSRPPRANEFEVSIIGPGFGECVILHLGDNEWCIVDSCIPQGYSEPVAVEYLNSFANRALENVKLIVATHWHDDHVRGLTSILERVPTASFACSVALRSREFVALAGTAAVGIDRRSSGIHEFASILDLIEAEAPKPRLGTPKWALEDRSILQLHQNGRSFPVSIKALSPSDPMVKSALADMARLLPKPGDLQRRIPNRSANHASVALWVEAGPLSVLLGADLEHEAARAGEGWLAVLQCHQGWAARPPAFLFKIPHHGSAGADCPQVWSQMLQDNPIAVVTPFNAGNVRLPKSSDLARISKRTTNLYCTAEGAGKPPPRDNLIERTMKEHLKGRRVLEGHPGHVRVCWPLDGQCAQPVVEVFYGACQVHV